MAVVGAGPTGVMLAIELARRGVNVKVFERLSEPPTESRATGIHARTLEIFRQLGLVEQFLAVGHRLDGFALHTQQRRPVRVRFDGLDTPYPFVLNLRQDVTQRILDRHLDRQGVTVAARRRGDRPAPGRRAGRADRQARRQHLTPRRSPPAGSSVATGHTASSAAASASHSTARTTARTG